HARARLLVYADAVRYAGEHAAWRGLLRIEPRRESRGERLRGRGAVTLSGHGAWCAVGPATGRGAEGATGYALRSERNRRRDQLHREQTDFDVRGGYHCGLWPLQHARAGRI